MAAAQYLQKSMWLRHILGAWLLLYEAKRAKIRYNHCWVENFWHIFNILTALFCAAAHSLRITGIDNISTLEVWLYLSNFETILFFFEWIHNTLKKAHARNRTHGFSGLTTIFKFLRHPHKLVQNNNWCRMVIFITIY